MPTEGPVAVSYGSLFRYATLRECGLIALGCVSAACTGVMTPVFALFFGNLLNAFFEPNFVSQVNKTALIILGVSAAAGISGTLQFSCLMWGGAQQANRVRCLYLSSLLSQDMAFFDTSASTSDLLHALREEALTYQEAVSDKLASFVQGVACFVGAMIVSFIRGWDLSLVVLASLPALVIVGAVCGIFTARLQARATKAYSQAGGIAQEAVSNLRTVAAYGQQEAVVKSYAAALDPPTKLGERQGLLAGFTLGSTHLVFFAAYALAIWYGSGRIADGDMDTGKVWSIILSCVLGGFSLGGAMPHLAVFKQGCVAAAGLFSVIERAPAQAAGGSGGDVVVTFTTGQAGTVGPAKVAPAAKTSQVLYPSDGAQLVPAGAACRGDLELANVTFAYPARPDRPVFSSLNLLFPAGKTTALVGESGSGKSTIIQLLLRLYDPTGGAVLLDGRDVRTLPLRWLRAQFGLVSQNPTLFASSIFDNIALDSGATSEQVVAAAVAANAHGFICKLPNGYDTVVGEKGSKLSGGQRQRIALARAVLRSPAVLLLDEATSALDAGCEKAVQAALEALIPGRTCITIAHRLSTVAAADAIHALKHGAVVESGTHRQLLEAGGYYASLAAKQALRLSDEGSGAGDDDAVATAGSGGRCKGPLRTVRDSVLRRGSVRLSVIPQQLLDKMRARKSREEEAGAPLIGFGRLLALNRPELRYLLLGLVCAVLAGLQMPGFSLALSEVLAGLYLPDPADVRSEGRKWALVFFCIGLGILVVETVEGWCFGVMGQRLATRLRTLMLKSLLRQEAAFFDRPENGPAALMSSLGGDAASVRGAVGDRLGVLATVLSCIVASYTIAFINSWSVTLVVTAVLPVLVASNGVLAKHAFGAAQADRGALAAANTLAAEALTSIRTVAAFNMQPSYARLYQQELQRGAQARAAVLAGLAFGCSQFFLLGVTSLGFWFGGTQIEGGRLGFKEMLTANMSVFYAAFGLAQAQTAFPELARAADAVRRTFAILDRKPEISPAGGAQMEMEGAVELRRVAFAYPSRPGRLILKEFSLSVAAGTSCALVGESGHGKSTIIALLERFYDPVEGQVLIDGINIASLSLASLRRQLALVGQEPVVFSASILDNITMGSGASSDAVKAAARAAHALDFVEALPEGFATRLGDGGSQLSGGQLQRLAVARAMLRSPRVLLLDEPTSALDSESERLVQAALDAFMEGRTTIVVAHRLSTVMACTSIAAVYRGRVLEQGSHGQLLDKAGYYRHLWEASQA